MPSKARTNWPVNCSPHFLHILTWPLPERPLLFRERFLSPLRRGGSSAQGADGGRAPGAGFEFVSLRPCPLSGVLRPELCQLPSTVRLSAWP